MQKHKKNTARYEAVPMLDSSAPETYKSGLTVSLSGYYKDGAGSWTAFTPSNAAAEIGSTGVYEVELTASEMNRDRVVVKLTGTGAADNLLSYDMSTKLWDDLNDFNASTDTVANVTLVDTTTTNTDMRGTDNAILSSSAPANFGDLAITATTGKVTVGTNEDKTGYSLSGTKTNLDALNDIAATDIVSNGAITTLAGAVVNVDTVDTTTTNSDMRGTDNASTFDHTTDQVTTDAASRTASQATGFSTHSAADVASLVLVTPANKLATDASGNVESNNMRGTDGASTFDHTTDEVITDAASRTASQATGFSTHSASDVASLVLVTPANKLATDASGNVEANNMRGTDNAILAASAPQNWSSLIVGTGADLGKVTTSNPAAGSGSAHTAQDVANLILVTPANKLATDASGNVEANNMRGTDGANTVAPANADISAIKAKTDSLTFSIAGQVDANALTGGGGDDAATIYSYFTSGTNEDAFKADVSGLSTFDPATDTVANVTTVADVTGLVTTDTASRDASKADISSLSTFDPATDVVARVTLVDTTTANTDMRGTDNAILASSAPANWSSLIVGVGADLGKVTTSNPASGGSNHTAEDVRDLILAGDKTPIAMATGSVSNVVLVDTTTDLTNGVGGDASSANQAIIIGHLTDIKGAGWSSGDDLDSISDVTGKLDGMIVADGPLWQYSTNALERAPSGGSGGTVGPGSISHTVNISSNGQPVDGAAVWISSDAIGANVVAGTLCTDAFGDATFMLDAGTYYLWAQKSGVNFPNPSEFTVSP